MCQRAFGEEIEIESATELGGGLYNNTYLVRITGRQPVILRVAPHLSLQLHSDGSLMHNELTSQAFLAPIAPLLPTILMADFTHQILERDYLFQTFMEGEQWQQIKDEFTSEEKRILWRQLGSITKKIHSVQGGRFGDANCGITFSTWSQAVLHGLTMVVKDIEEARLDASDIRLIQSIAQAHQTLLDEITQLHFMHGDLWTVNILVKRGEQEPRISAVIDSDRAHWGDPMSDWTIFLLHIHAGTEADAFWETYGQPEQSLGVQFRTLIYRGKALAGIRLEQHRLGNDQNIKRTYREMQDTLEELKKLPLTQP